MGRSLHRTSRTRSQKLDFRFTEFSGLRAKGLLADRICFGRGTPSPYPLARPAREHLGRIRGAPHDRRDLREWHAEHVVQHEGDPRGDTSRPPTGVFATRSPDRPNPIGLHAVVIETVEEYAITVRDLEAIDGTPVLDVKPVLGRLDQR